MEDYEVKDIILKYVIENKGKMTLEIAEELKLDHDQVYSCCIEIEKLNHINLINVATKGARYVSIVDATPIGINFFNTTGGYNKNRTNEIIKTWWKELRAPIISGVLILLITLLADRCQDQLSAQKYEQIKTQSEYQTRQIDTIKMLISSDTSKAVLPKSDTTVVK